MLKNHSCSSQCYPHHLKEMFLCIFNVLWELTHCCHTKPSYQFKAQTLFSATTLLAMEGNRWSSVMHPAARHLWTFVISSTLDRNYGLQPVFSFLRIYYRREQHLQCCCKFRQNNRTAHSSPHPSPFSLSCSLSLQCVGRKMWSLR